jgi:hypothetical protein
MMSKTQWIAPPPPDVGYILAGTRGLARKRWTGLPGANDDRVELAHPGTTPIAL